jgi:hypothetical protein
MKYRDGASYLWVAVITSLCAGAGCGSSQATADGGGGSCSANVPKGQACNTLANVGAAITPACMAGTIPAGSGGAIVDGTYTLTAQTYYGTTACPSTPVNATIEIAGGCVQEVAGATIQVTASIVTTVAGASITRTVTCLDLGVDAGPLSVDTATATFTATPTTFTIFIKNSGTSSPNPDRVETYQKR